MLKEEQLTEHIAEGEKKVFEIMIQRYHPAIFNHLECLLKDRVKAEDLTQETFLKLYRQVKDRQIPLNTRAWLFSVANNLCRDYWRSAGYRKEMQILDQLPEQRDRKGQVIDILEFRENRSEMVSLLKELPESQRQIVYLRFYNELKLKEIASELACPVGTVKSRLFHALRFLKSRIEEKGNVNYG